MVECTFTTGFDDHIFVTVDADAFFFLHDLITSYLKEKEKVIGPQIARSGSPNMSIGSQASNSLDVSATNIGSSTLSMVSDTNSMASQQAAMGSSKNLTNLSGGSSSNNVNSSEDLRHVIGNKKFSSSKPDKVDMEMALRIDWRNFNCKSWQLEPTIR
jgi:Fragile site-associated protein C-terminus